MKKILALVVLSVMSFHAFSQDKLVKYQGEVVFGYGFGIGDMKVNKANLQIINGIRIGKYVAVGAGVGLDCCGKSCWGFSAFGDLKGYLPVSQKASLFVAADVGGGWGYANSLGVRNGVILVPAVGVSIKVSPKSAVNLSIAYTNQDIKGREEPRFNYHNYSALGFKVAFQF